MTNLETNRKLASLLGWTNIVDVGGALLGCPPPGEPECRGQARVPDWTGDWADWGSLMDFEIRQLVVEHIIKNLETKGK